LTVVNPLDQATLLLRTRAGLKDEPAGRARLERLLQESANLAGIPMHSYVDSLDSEPAAFDDLLDRVTVQHSGFFRDPPQFLALAEIARIAGSEPHTVWSAGCGNGQEPYSLAMLLDETGHRNWQVIATDVSFRALARTEIGRYTEAEVGGLSQERRQRYLLPRPGGYELAPFLRQNMHIKHHNLALTDAGSVVTKPTVVFCRNVLMYFGREESESTVQRFAECMPAGAHLFLGHSDSPGRMAKFFEAVRVADVPCYRRLGAAPKPRPAAGNRKDDLHPAPDVPGLLAEGDRAAAGGDLRAAIRAFRQATYLNPHLAIAYFQLGAALDLAGEGREARRAFGAAGLAMMSGEGDEDLAGLGGYTRRDLARAIAAKLTEDPNR
jgi:chemotaxis protein methyltransferase CheR